MSRREAALAEALGTILGDRKSPDDPEGDDTDQMWWNHPEWPDDEELLVGVTVGQMRAWSALLQS